MRKLYSFLFSSLFLCTVLNAQYQVNGAAVSSPSPGYPNEFQLVPPTGDHVAGTVFNTTQINLTQNFELNAQMYFGVNDDKGDGIALVLQNEGPGYMGNYGAGLGYHRFDGVYPSNIPADNPGPVPSFIIEFDTYQNGFIGNADIGDPAGDHIGFMSHSQAYHTSTSALAPPVAFPSNIEDGQWHDVKFSWNASTHTMTVSFLGNTYSYTGDITTTCLGGNPTVYWGFTAATGDPSNEHRVRIINMTIGSNLSITGNVTNNCTGGNIDITVTGGSTPYSYSWSNGSTSEDLTNVAPGNYTVTVTDNAGATKQATFTVSGDVTPPTVSCTGSVTYCENLFNYYVIPSLSASDNCGIGSITYTITGATNRSGTGTNASGFFNPGVSTITWTVKDKKGNTSKCTTVVTINHVSVNIPDVYAVNPGGNANTIYIGYGPTSLTLTANVTGGTPPYSYQWSTGATTSSITVSPSSPGVYSYVVLVKDSKGCYGFMLKQVRVVDIRCGNNKVIVCHNKNEICISKNAVPDHLGHGDKLGSCKKKEDGDNDENDRTQATGFGDETTIVPSFKAYPNPSNGKFEMQLSNANVGKAQVMVLNVNGMVVENRSVQLNGTSQILKFDLSKQSAGIYLVRVITSSGITTEKVLIRK